MTKTMTRRNFLQATAAFAAVPALAETQDRYTLLQKQIDDVTPAVWRKYRATGDTQGKAALETLAEAFTKVTREIGETVVAARPAVWYVYNMGFIVKTRTALFSIDLLHPRATELVPQLDFALITHNHGDHYSEPFLQAMDKAGKTVIQNFACNYGVKDRKKGGYTRAEKTFHIKDVAVSTALTDHNDYLIDFTTAFEITVGDFTIYHTGDCATARKVKLLKPKPDLWMVHPRCGLNPCAGAEVIAPARTIIGHLNEMGHAPGHARWTWQDGLAEKAKLEAAGHPADVPLWGTRLV